MIAVKRILPARGLPNTRRVSRPDTLCTIRGGIPSASNVREHPHVDCVRILSVGVEVAMMCPAVWASTQVNDLAFETFYSMEALSVTIIDPFRHNALWLGEEPR